MKLRLLNDLKASPKLALILCLSFLSPLVLEHLFINTLSSLAGLSSVDLDLLPKNYISFHRYGVVAIILLVMLSTFRLSKSNSPHFFAIIISVLSTSLIYLVNRIAFNLPSFLEVLNFPFAIYSMIFVWIILYQMKENKAKSLAQGVLAYLSVNAIFLLIENLFYINLTIMSVFVECIGSLIDLGIAAILAITYRYSFMFLSRILSFKG